MKPKTPKKPRCSNCGEDLKDNETAYWHGRQVCERCYLQLNYNQRLKENAIKNRKNVKNKTKQM